MSEAVKLSAGVKAAWQIGADLALQSSSALIEPIHLLYGLLSLEKHVDTVVPNSHNEVQLEEIRAEAESLVHLWADSSPTISEIRRRIRMMAKPPGAAARSSSKIGRSPQSKQLFGAAQEAAITAQVPLVNSLYLLRALVEGDAFIASCVPDTVKEGLRRRRGVDERLTSALPASGATISAPEEPEPEVSVAQSLDATTCISHDKSMSLTDRLARLCEMTWQFGVHSALEPVLQSICEELLKALPGAERASVLLIDKETDEFLLKAHAPAVPHRISQTCAKRAVEERRSFLWYRAGELTRSQLASDAQSGIYSPLVAEGKVLGVICMDSLQSRRGFESDDLFLVTVMAHQLALAIANRNLQLTLASNAEVLQRLLTNFSPQVRKRLLEKAERGRLRLGGERSQVSILCSDIRGFTRLSASMDAEDVVNMLNDYFSKLTECIFRNDGCIDKFIGDAILAVFGSPEPDPQHRLKSVKAAADMQQCMEEVSRLRKARNEPICEIGIGVHSGEVLHGFIGSLERMEYTVIGDTVNKAARYCDAANAGEVIISPDIYQYVWREVVATQVSVATKHEGTITAHRLTFGS